MPYGNNALLIERDILSVRRMEAHRPSRVSVPSETQRHWLGHLTNQIHEISFASALAPPMHEYDHGTHRILRQQWMR